MRHVILAMALSLGVILGSYAADDAEPTEPVIEQCQKDHLCTCEELGGDVYDEGLTIRCLFPNTSVEVLYAYFKKYHSPNMRTFLPPQLPKRDRTLRLKDPEEPGFKVTVYHYVYKHKKHKIQVDYRNGGYGYTFAQQGSDATLDFTYNSYN
jgi:hypothetical protein